MGGSDGTIIGHNLKAAMQLSLSKRGSVKLWHGLVLTHALCALAGWLL